MQGELLRLMINFKLCYQVPNTKFYICLGDSQNLAMTNSLENKSVVS